MTSLCVVCGVLPPDAFNNKCPGCYAAADPVGYQQTIDHRRRKAERAEAEKKAREERENPTKSKYADEARQRIIAKRDMGIAPPNMITCQVCVSRGNVRKIGLHERGKCCPLCFQRHRTALFDTGLPDFSTRDPEADEENHFPPEIMRTGI